MVVFDEQRAINRTVVAISLVSGRLTKEFSREWLETTLRRYLRQGLIEAVKVVEAADHGDELADQALREVGAELQGRPFDGSEYRPEDLQILAYAQRALLRPPHRRGRGIAWYDCWYRNLAVCWLVDLTCKEFDLKPTRSRGSRRADRHPSGISVVVAALARNGIVMDEQSVQTHIWLGLPGDLARQAIAERFWDFFPHFPR
jgi:hypothetical protein